MLPHWLDSSCIRRRGLEAFAGFWNPDVMQVQVLALHISKPQTNSIKRLGRQLPTSVGVEGGVTERRQPSRVEWKREQPHAVFRTDETEEKHANSLWGWG